MRLVQSAGVRRHRGREGPAQPARPALFAGSGKVEEIGRAADELNADVVVFNHALSPAQERNLEKAIERRVHRPHRADPRHLRAARADHEGKLQVELAQLEHLSTRLVRGWTHLERQRGGIGMTGGPGETQLELDRRYIGEARQDAEGEARPAAEAAQRAAPRARARRDVLSVSLVGYTNAGKSTLFNALAARQGLRGRPAVRHARHHHAAGVDARGRQRGACPTRWASSATCRTAWWRRSAPRSRRRCTPTCCCTWSTRPRRCATSRSSAVDKVLAEIGAGEAPQLLVWNKIDRGADWSRGVERDEYGRISRVFVSARTGAGLELLRGAIAEFAKARASANRRAGASIPLLAYLTEHLQCRLNDPNWGRGSRGPQGPGGGNQGPPDLDELWRNFNRRLSELFGRARRGGDEPPRGRPERARPAAAAPAC